MSTPPKVFPDRWHLSRAGIVNVWHYLDNEFDLSGGRMILRGTNGSGKSRALELLLPFLLDADRRKIDATGSARVSLQELMRFGAEEQTSRLGYLWLELANEGGHLTLGALIRSNRSTDTTSVWYFITPLRVGHDLQLISTSREPLTRQGLAELIGANAITDIAETHRDRVRSQVFGLRADSTHDRDRFSGLLQLLHTLRSPDVGNRIDEGRLPQILSDSLPPLDEQTLQRAGEKLDGLTTLRQAQQRLEESHQHVRTFLHVYRDYAADTVADSAEQTLAAVDALDGATREAQRRLADFERLHREEGDARADLDTSTAEVKEIQHAISGLRARDIFKQADELAQRDRVVETYAVTADAALNEAERERAGLERVVEAANGRLAELRHEVSRGASGLAQAREALSAARLTATALPAEIRLVDGPTPHRRVAVRANRNAEPKSVELPQPDQVELVPSVTEDVEHAAQASAQAAAHRKDLADRRLHEARRLERDEQAVARLEADAGRESAQAEADQQEADAAALERDDSAVALATNWREWVDSPTTAGLLGAVDWASSRSFSMVLHDVEALCGYDETRSQNAVLDELDRLAADRAGAALAELAARRAELELEQRGDDARSAELVGERERLQRAEDPAPTDAPWLLVDRPGVPLWRAVDFDETVSEVDRAGIEAALLASGLLTARVEADGSLRAHEGMVLLSPSDVPVGTPLTTALHADPAGDIDPELVHRVLSGIGLDDGSPTSIGRDGTWRHGPLRGRYTTARARHIGAAARARARQERLDAIAIELDDLGRASARRRSRLGDLAERAAAIEEHVASAPRSNELRTTRRLAAAAADRARRSHTRATETTGRARAARVTWASALATHRDACGLYELPVEADGLALALTAVDQAERTCRELAHTLASLRAFDDRHRRSLDDAARRAAEVDAAHERADAAWNKWHDTAAEVAAIHEALDLDVEQARAELLRSSEALAKAEATAKSAAVTLETLIGKAATAHSEADHARNLAEQRRTQMSDLARQFTRRVALAGLASAATETPLHGVERPDVEESVRAAAAVAATAVTRPSRSVPAGSVMRAFQIFDRNVAGQLDVTSTVEDGVTLVTVVGAGDDRTIAGAAAALAHRLEVGRTALSEREREVFTTFVLGGVAEELRRRINQASDLVDAMNDSLRTISTSNGIGVRLSWRLADDSPELRRIAELIRTADAVRSPAQNTELTELLRRRVDEFYAVDPSSGYALHLAQALDYRRWHSVEVTILGPNPGQERRISSRAKLSQGETRFVSYVTLFAAADSYLSGLSRTGTQLRVILLDDAFAKVDEPTIAELMGLLVRLDLDFVMTGHALWGCYPQVPRLDIYEVRRQEGTSAVTTHVHWDGHSRHLRSTA